MRRAFSIVTIFLGTIAILGLPTPAAAHVGGEHIQVIARTVSEHYEDNGRKGESVGDYFTFTDHLMKRGDRVGHAVGRCDVMRATRQAFSLQCTATLTFGGKGQLTVQGAITFRQGNNDDPTLAVTGGTGDYAGASGEFVLIERREGPTRYSIHLAE